MDQGLMGDPDIRAKRRGAIDSSDLAPSGSPSTEDEKENFPRPLAIIAEMVKNSRLVSGRADGGSARVG